MRRSLRSCLALPAAAIALMAPIGIGLVEFNSKQARAQTAAALRGPAAFGSWHDDMPGKRRHLTVDALPAPYATPSVGNMTRVVRAPPASARLEALPGFSVRLLASGLSNPRLLRVAPNGDIFVAETGAGRVRVLRTDASGTAVEKSEIFASGLRGPFGIAFYPAENPAWVYVANMDSVVRYAYQDGDMRPRGAAETIVRELPTGGHTTRDVAFSKDGTRMFVSVGSATNDAENMGRRDAAAVKRWEQDKPPGAAWDADAERADVLVFDPLGGNGRIFATGIRNCVGLAINPTTGDPWCATNERDGFGDNLPPDYVTRVREGGFYGWPWYYMGAHEDPRHPGERPDLKNKVAVPDVLIQPHSAPLQMMFYDGDQFPADFKGNAFVALHGSWNRATRTGYKIVRVIVKDGVPTGEYEDFVTGFVLDDASVWGRPVGVAQAKDGALLFSEDGNGTIWRVAAGNRE